MSSGTARFGWLGIAHAEEAAIEDWSFAPYRSSKRACSSSKADAYGAIAARSAHYQSETSTAKSNEPTRGPSTREEQAVDSVRLRSLEGALRFGQSRPTHCRVIADS